MTTVTQLMESCFRHFNAAETLAAAQTYRAFVDDGGAVVWSLAGAMSTAELGVILARMIRAQKLQAICSTAANIEEDLYGLLARREYKTKLAWRHFTASNDLELRDDSYNRITDTAIPESVIESATDILRPMWREAALSQDHRFPYEWFYEALLNKIPRSQYHADPSESWLLAAAEAALPLFCPGFEDSSTASMMVADVLNNRLHAHVIRSGTEELERFARWYLEESRRRPIGLVQIGGGIAGDFAVSVAPLLLQDAVVNEAFWQFFVQISDSTTSYGSYSGAPPSEKITWWKVQPETPAFMIESDATIVVPLICSYVLGE